MFNNYVDCILIAFNLTTLFIEMLLISVLNKNRHNFCQQNFKQFQKDLNPYKC